LPEVVVPEQQESWMDAYKTAMLELDRSKLPVRIEQARVAVEQRLRELSSTSIGNEAQVQALSDALQNLRVLSRSETGEAR
jgi:hypothetical protein